MMMMPPQTILTPLKNRFSSCLVDGPGELVVRSLVQSFAG